MKDKAKDKAKSKEKEKAKVKAKPVKKAVAKKPIAAPAAKGSRKFRGVWTDQELETLQRLYPSMTNAEIAKKLGRPKASVDKKGFDHGLKKDSDHRRKVAISNNKKRRNSWTKEEEAMLKKLYQKHTYREMASMLNRNPQSIQSKATKLGLWKYQTVRLNNEQ